MTVSYPFAVDEEENPYYTHNQQYENPFLKARRQSCRMEASDLEPFTLVDEVEFSRRFRDIARLADDDSDDATLLHSTEPDYNGDNSSYNHFPMEASDGNVGFNSRLLAPMSSSSTTSQQVSRVSSYQASPRRRPSFQDKSFLDDDWLLNRVEHDSNMAMVASGLVRPRSAFHFDERSKTPAPDFKQLNFSSLNVSKGSSPIRHEYRDGINRPKQQSNHHNSNSGNSGPPPIDYVCKLCNVSGHWLKDCELFEPREGNSGKLSSNLKQFKNLTTTAGQSTHKNTGPPPGNYVCRLCGVSGHWIEQCSHFQPKAAENKPSGNSGTLKERLACFKSIPPPPGYICNLCHLPGHWLQQCSRFEPINVQHRRKDPNHHHCRA